MYTHAAWINPQPESRWEYHESIALTRRLMGERMFPLSLEGLDRAMRALASAASRRIRRFSGQGLSNLLWGLRALGS